MPDNEPAKPSRSSAALNIDPKWRWVAAAVGFIGLGAGGWATFTTDVEGGPVAMLLIGLIFLFIAMRGELPTSVKISDNEVSWLSNAAAEQVINASPEEKPAQIERVAELERLVPGITVQALTAVALRDAAADLVRGVATSIPNTTIKELASGYSGRQILLLSGPGGGNVLIDILPPGFPSTGGAGSTNMPPTWAILTVGVDSTPPMWSADDRPAAAFVYRSESRFKRDALVEVLENLLEESRALVQAERGES